MKKLLLILVAMVYLFAFSNYAAAEQPNKLSIVTTIFPAYDWVKNILGEDLENVDLVMLLNDGADLHSYQPTAKDIATIASADLFVCVGGESDEWVDGVLKSANNPNLQVIKMEDLVEARPEEVVEGMQEEAHDHHHHQDEDHDHDHAEADHDHDHAEADHDHAEADHDHDHAESDHDHDHAEADHDHDHTEADHDHDHAEADHDHDHEHAHTHDGEPVNDEHVWLSLKFAHRIVGAIAERLAELNPEKAEMYRTNAAAYQKELMALDRQYQAVVDSAARRDILFADRFPFRYLADDYGLKYSAAFVGCSAETEASFETIAYLAGKVNQLDLPAVFTIEGATHKIADTVIQNSGKTDVKVLTMNSMQSVTTKQVEEGLSYLDVMKANLAALEAGLK